MSEPFGSRSEPEGESNGAEGGTRTPTVLLPPAPQAGASANSATSARREHRVWCRISSVSDSLRLDNSRVALLLAIAHLASDVLRWRLELCSMLHSARTITMLHSRRSGRSLLCSTSRCRQEHPSASAVPFLTKGSRLCGTSSSACVSLRQPALAKSRVHRRRRQSRPWEDLPRLKRGAAQSCRFTAPYKQLRKTLSLPHSSK